MSATYDDIDFGMLLWPDSFKFRALMRAKEKAGENPHLWELYQKFFALFGNTSKPPVPFSGDVLDLNSEQMMHPSRADLPLSVVVITRNDLHVERMQDRTQSFIDGIMYLAETHKTNVELIIVEWNPPADRPPMAEQFIFPDSSEYCTIKIVTVPSALHDTYDWAERLPLYQMIGKNAGVRRARGQFVLVTNIDILLSHSLFEYITASDRKSGYIYRSNRWDVDMDILDIVGAEKQISTAPDKCFRINYREGGIPFSDRHVAREKVETFDPEHMWYPDLHTEGCGDFQMLHRDDWIKVRGYAETDCFCYHMDSLFAFTCHFAGLREKALSDEFPHFHVDHTVGTVVDSDVYTIAEKQTVRHISCESIIALSSQMFHEKDYLVFNRANWGLSDHQLPVSTVTRAAWETEPEQAPGNTRLGVDPTFGKIGDFPLLNSSESEEGKAWLEDCAKSLEHYVSTFLPDRKIFIWGAGLRGQYCRAALEQHTNVQVAGYLQSNSPSSSQQLGGLPLQAAHAMSWVSGEGPFILIASIHAETIRETVAQWGLLEGIDYLVWS